MIPLLLLLAAAPPAPVVRVARGPVTVQHGVESVRAASGGRLEPGDAVETGPHGFAELHLPGVARLRLSASTRVILEQGGLRLVGGRLWAQVGRGSGIEVRTLKHRTEVQERSSVIVEHSSIGGTVVTVRAGAARMMEREGAAAAPIRVGEVIRVVSGQQGVPPARIGGKGLSDLVVVESRRALRDPLGVESFLLRSALAVTPARRRAADVTEQVRAGSEVGGSENAPFGRLVEEGLRPPPFFEEEVPPKGPNVRVRVDFGEE